MLEVLFIYAHSVHFYQWPLTTSIWIELKLFFFLIESKMLPFSRLSLNCYFFRDWASIFLFIEIETKFFLFFEIEPKLLPSCRSACSLPHSRRLNCRPIQDSCVGLSSFACVGGSLILDCLPGNWAAYDLDCSQGLWEQVLDRWEWQIRWASPKKKQVYGYIEGSHAVYCASPNCSFPQISKWDSLTKLCRFICKTFSVVTKHSFKFNSMQMVSILLA